jgi:calcium-independent phospholipase A2
MSPLQVAVKMGNLRTVQALLVARASLEHLDCEANSVFHYAANTTKNIILVNNTVIIECFHTVHKLKTQSVPVFLPSKVR